MTTPTPLRPEPQNVTVNVAPKPAAARVVSTFFIGLITTLVISPLPIWLIGLALHSWPK